MPTGAVGLLVSTLLLFVQLKVVAIIVDFIIE